MPWLEKEQRLSLARIVLAGTILFGIPVVTARDSNTRVEQQQVIDLGLKIDENGFWKAIQQGPRFGSISKNTIDCLKPLGDFCISDASANFEISLNRPMLDFVFAQANLLNPSIPTRMQFVEDWVGDQKEGPVGAFNTITDDGSEQIIFVSLKAAALSAFKNLEKNNLPAQEYFDGAVSFFISSFSAHEFAHSGAETKKLFRRGEALPSNDLLERIHPQIFAFQDRYTKLYLVAQNKNLGENSIIFKVIFKGTNIQAYKQQIFSEAKALGLD